MYCVSFFFKQKTAYEMLISDWSSDVCSSDLFNALFCKLYAMILFINYKIQLSIYLVHFPLLVLKIMVLRFLKYLFHTGFTQEFDQRLVFRQSTIDRKRVV